MCMCVLVGGCLVCVCMHVCLCVHLCVCERGKLSLGWTCTLDMWRINTAIKLHCIIIALIEC